MLVLLTGIEYSFSLLNVNTLHKICGCIIGQGLFDIKLICNIDFVQFNLWLQIALGLNLEAGIWY